MAHEPKLTVYKIKLNPSNSEIEKTNRYLFKNKINEFNDDLLNDSYIITQIFKIFITDLDTNEMYSDKNTKKCMTANQANILDENVNTNIRLHTDQNIIEGIVEGGSFGRKKNKTSTVDKKIKSNIDENDAITEDFYFMLYAPLKSDISILILQSYSDETIDSVMKKFWENFYSYNKVFNKAKLERYYPESIINDFKKTAEISSFTFSTQVAGQTLMDDTSISVDRSYKVEIKITPTKKNLSYKEFDQAKKPLQNTLFTKLLKLGGFEKKKAQLKDNTTNNTSVFDLGSNFDIHPVIQLSKYIELKGDQSDFELIKEYCFKLLDEIKGKIYNQNAIQER